MLNRNAAELRICAADLLFGGKVKLAVVARMMMRPILAGCA
jgi:hypothetical protein